MSQKFLKQLEKRCQERPLTLAFPEGDDERVQTAATRLIENRCADKIILVGDKASHLSGKCTVISPEDSAMLEKSHQVLQGYLNRKQRSLSKEQEKLWLSHPANQVGALLALGEADAAVGGCVLTTGEIIKASLQTIGLAKDTKIMSSSFVMVSEEKQKSTHYVYADCGVIIQPDENQLAQLCKDSVDTFQSLFPGETPKVAFLSFSTKGSAQDESTLKMIKACEIFRKNYPQIAADGELQFDAAIVPAIGKRKAPGSEVAGDANIFIFPDLNAGNIAYKITQRLAGFDAFGPILQGGAKPYSDLSRGASTDDIYTAALITSLRA